MNTPLLPAAFFAQRGVLQVFEGFLDPERCRKLARQMRNAPSEAAQVYEDAPGQKTRQTRNLKLPDELIIEIGQPIANLVAILNPRFNCLATEIQLMQFLRYNPGDYFRKHRDWTPTMSKEIRPRLISFVLFVNVPGEPEAGGYRGGELVFYLPQSNGMSIGLAIQPQPGLLICFHPELLHEVREVSAGVRLSVAGWLY